jgi:hypothetical protein
MGGWLVINLDNTKPCREYYGLINLCLSSAPKEANNILVFGGGNQYGPEDD